MVLPYKFHYGTTTLLHGMLDIRPWHLLTSAVFSSNKCNYNQFESHLHNHTIVTRLCDSHERAGSTWAGLGAGLMCDVSVGLFVLLAVIRHHPSHPSSPPAVTMCDDSCDSGASLAREIGTNFHSKKHIYLYIFLKPFWGISKNRRLDPKVCADPPWLPISKMVWHFTIGSAVWMLELSKVGCEDLWRFGKFFGGGERKTLQF